MKWMLVGMYLCTGSAAVAAVLPAFLQSLDARWTIGRVCRWRRELRCALTALSRTGEIPDSHGAAIRHLRKPAQLAAFRKAWDSFCTHPAREEYFRCTDERWQRLTYDYCRKSAPSRCLLAAFLAEQPGWDRRSADAAETLLRYPLGDAASTLAVLQALCAMGREDGIVQMLDRINRTKAYIHPLCLAKTLAAFSSSANVLADRLLEQYTRWDAAIGKGVIMYLTGLPVFYGAQLLPVLLTQSSPLQPELVSYFGTHPLEGARPFLEEQLSAGTELAPSCARALGAYPESRAVLRKALTSFDFSVRKGAAAGIACLGVTPEDVPADRYGSQMLAWSLESMGEKEVLWNQC